MDANLDNIAKELYGKIQTRFPSIKIGDEKTNVLSKKEDIPKARFFEFEYSEGGKPLGTITMNLDPNEGLLIQFSGDLVDDETNSTHAGAYKFIRSFRQFAKDRLLKFDASNIGKSNLDKRDYKFLAKSGEGNMMESKLFGTSRVSYQDLGETRLIIKHSQPVNTELAAGRTMHIESIYIENAEGERFKYPAKHLNGARALAEHIAHGGTPYDAIGKHITDLSEELSSLRKFKGYVSRQTQLSEAMGPITDKVVERIESIKSEVRNLQKSSYYESFAESFQAKEERAIPEDIMNDWIDRLTIRTFNEELKSVFPYLYNIVDESEVPVKELSADDLLGEEKSEDTCSDCHKDPCECDDEKELDEMAELEDFIEQIVAEGEEVPNSLFSDDPKVQKSAIEKLNDLFQSEIKAGGDGVNGIQTLKGIIDDPELVDSLKGIDSDLDIRPVIQAFILEKDKAEGTDVASKINFDGEGETGAAPAEPEAPAAEPTAAAEPAAEPAPAEPQTPTAESHGKLNPRLVGAIKKAHQAGAKLDTRINIGGKEMTLHDAIEECGMTPMECGFENNGSSLEEIKKFMSGFYNRQDKNFTIGGERMKIKLEKEFPDAHPEDLKMAFALIDKLDPGSNEHNQILRLAGVKQHDHAVDEGGEMQMPNFDALMQQAQGMPGAKVTKTSSGTINGKPASYDDAMNKFKSMKLKVGDDEIDLNDPDKAGEKFKGMMGNMMKGVQGQVPNQNVQFPGGQMNPADMMKQIMQKINFGN